MSVKAKMVAVVALFTAIFATVLHAAELGGRPGLSIFAAPGVTPERLSNATNAGSNYVQSVASGLTNKVHAGDSAGSNYVQQVALQTSNDLPNASVAYADSAGTAANADFATDCGTLDAMDSTAFFWLDQTTPQTVSGGSPLFSDGAFFGASRSVRVSDLGIKFGLNLGEIGETLWAHIQVDDESPTPIITYGDLNFVNSTTLNVATITTARVVGQLNADGGGNVMTNGNASFTWVSNAVVHLSNAVFNCTNLVGGGWYSIDNNLTSLLWYSTVYTCRVSKVTGVSSRPGSCTGRLWRTSTPTNLTGAVLVTNIIATSTGSVVVCSEGFSFGAALWQDSGVGGTTCTNFQILVEVTSP